LVRFPRTTSRPSAGMVEAMLTAEGIEDWELQAGHQVLLRIAV
jgi:hypothetical protein